MGSIWTTHKGNKITKFKELLSNLSLKTRAGQLEILMKRFSPDKKTTVVDVGFAPQEELKDTNFFEKNYPFPKNVTAVSVEDCSEIKDKYPNINIVEVEPGQGLPFEDGHFDIAVSWATLEHVGGYKKQEDFLNELLRVGKSVFLTTPNRGVPYEPHTGFWFLHWLPLDWFRKICEKTGRKFWSLEDVLNPLYTSNIKKMKLRREVDTEFYKLFNFLPSHIIITSHDKIS